MEWSGSGWWGRIRAQEIPRKWVYLAAGGLILFKLWLVVSLAVTAYGGAWHDDRLYLNGAANLLNGKWMGRPYTQMTLAKGPFYPMFIAGSFLLGVPLRWAQQFLYAFACGLFARCLARWVPSRLLRLLVFAVLLFNPMSYSDGPSTRVIREGIYSSLTLLVVACLLGLLARLDDGSRFKRVLFGMGLGLSFSAFWLTRDEGVWIVPVLVLLLPLAILGVGRLRRAHWSRRLQAVGAAGIAAALSLGVVVLINGHRYGIYVTNEFKSGWFISAIGALQRVKPVTWRLYVPVPREVRERIYAVSPKFRELRSYMEEGGGKGWADISCTPGLGPYRVCDDMSAGLFTWALRDGVAETGYYLRGGRAVAEYYTGLATEVNSACDTGALDCLPRRDSLVIPWRSEHARNLRPILLSAFDILAGFADFRHISGRSSGDRESLNLFQDVTRGPLAPEAETILRTQRVWDAPRQRVLLAIGHVYQGVTPILTILALALWGWGVIRAIWRRRFSALHLIATALLSGAVARVGLLVLISLTAFPAVNGLYMSGASPLLLGFIPLVFLDAARWQGKPNGERAIA